jgi:predicted amidophosphoribosyltransferase
VNIDRLATYRKCPRCTKDKTLGMALCRRCRYKLPPQMRRPLEHIATKNEGLVYGALRAAASYFDMHDRSIRDFGGGRRR